MSNSHLPQFSHAYWQEDRMSTNFPPLESSITADICVVGGGITGITTALLLAKNNYSVVLIDAHQLMCGTTGSTTAKITAQHQLIYDELIKNLDINRASLYFDAAMEGKYLIEKFIDEYSIECDFSIENAYIYTNSNDYLDQLKLEQKAYEQIGIPSELVHDIPLNIPHKLALMMKNQAQFHPLKYLSQLIKQLEKHDVQIFEHTRATDIEYGKNISVKTANNNRIHCKKLIQASHYPFFDGSAFFPLRMYAERSYVLALQTDEPFPEGIYINAETPTRSLRKVTNNLILIAGENHKTGQERRTNEKYFALEQFANKHFPKAKIKYHWSAQDYTTIDKVPYIGHLTKNHKNIYVATGFRKWGMTTGTVAAKILADLIMTGESKYERLFKLSRFNMYPSLKNIMKANVDVAKHLMKGKFDKAHNNLHHLKKDQATIIKRDSDRIGIYKDPDENIFAVDTTCTHMGCELIWNRAERTWDCPCHGSRFTYEGTVIEGPAQKSLKTINEDNLLNK